MARWHSVVERNNRHKSSRNTLAKLCVLRFLTTPDYGSYTRNANFFPPVSIYALTKLRRIYFHNRWNRPCLSINNICIEQECESEEKLVSKELIKDQRRIGKECIPYDRVATSQGSQCSTKVKREKKKSGTLINKTFNGLQWLIPNVSPTRNSDACGIGRRRVGLRGKDGLSLA